jgi:flagellum-specific peptidoglycan hydrolase FlgJ
MTNEIDVQKLLEALNISADAAADSIGRMRGEIDLGTESLQDSVKTQRDIEKEFDKLGLVLKETTGVEKDLYTTRKKSEEQLKKRQKLDEETNKVMEEAIPNWKNLSEAQKKEEKARLASANLLDSQLASMNRVIDENNKLVDQTVRMNKADLLRLNMVQREEAAIKKHDQAVVGSANSLMDLPKKLGVMAVKFAMDRLIGSIDATYKGLVAYEDALLAGANDEVTMGIQRREQMQAEADAHGNLGESLKSLGGEMVILGVTAVAGGVAIASAGGAAALLELALVAATGPIGWIVGAITAAAGAFIWFKGREEEQTKKSIEYAKKRDEDLGKQNKALFDGYEKLSDSALVGSRGLQGMFDDLQKVGLTVSQFDKLNKVLQANQKDMKLFGAGLVDGAKQFSDNAGKLINSELGGQLRAMGINQEQQMEHMAQFMAQQSKLGAKASGDQAKAAANYVLELDKMAVLTGASRKEQEDARKAILSMNQLRAAMLEAEDAGDTKKLEELTRVFETSSALMAAGLKNEGAALAKLGAAGGGPVDAETARVYQAMSGAGGTLEMIKSGQGSNVDRTQAAISGLMKQNRQFAGTTKLTGGVPGQTMGEGDLGTLIDLSKSQDKIKEAAAKGSMSPEEYAAAQRKPAADAEKGAKDRIALQKEGLEKDKGLREGKLTYPGAPGADQAKFGEAVSSFMEGVDKWVGNVADSMFGKGWWAKYGPGGEQDQENWRITKELFNNMWDSAGKEFGPWWDKYGIGGEVDKKNWEITKKAFDDMWTGTKNMTSEISSSFSKAYDSGKEMLSNLSTSMVSIVSKIGDEVGKAFQGMIDKIIDSVKNIIKMIPGASTAIEAGGKAVDTVKGAAKSVAGAASSAWGGVTGYFDGGPFAVPSSARAPAAAPSRGAAPTSAAPAASAAPTSAAPAASAAPTSAAPAASAASAASAAKPASSAASAAKPASSAASAAPAGGGGAASASAPASGGGTTLPSGGGGGKGSSGQTATISSINAPPVASVTGGGGGGGGGASSGAAPQPAYGTPSPVKGSSQSAQASTPKLPDSPPPQQDGKTSSGTKPTTVSASGTLDSKGPPGGKFKNKDEFVKTMYPWAQYASSILGAPALGILGQWAGESGTGSSLPAEYNYAGIKAGNKFAKGDFVLTEERYNQKQLDRAMKSGEDLAGVLGPNDTIKKKGKNVTIDQWYGAGAYQSAKDKGLDWVQVKSYFAKFGDLKDFTDSYVSFLRNPRYAEAMKAGSAEDFGKAVASAGYATASADKYGSHVGDFAKSVNVSASLEGIAKGPESGYAAQLHGTELIKRLTPNSILDQLANTPAPTVGQTKSDGTVDVLAEIHQMMEDKFNTMISALRDGNDLTDKILKYSMV